MSKSNAKTDNDPKIEEEGKSSGSVDAKVYWKYIRAGAGPLLLMGVIISILVSQTIIHYSDLWLAEWTNIEDSQNSSEQIGRNFEINHVIIYSSLMAANFITILIRMWTFYLMCTTASVVLHNKIFFRLLRAPITIFDNNPIG